MSSSIIEIIGHYQRSIDKSTNDEARLLHCIDKLYRLPVTVDHLQQTGIGKTVNSLRKYDKQVGIAAKALVAKWKAMVAAEEDVNKEEDHKEQYDDDPYDDNQNSYNGNQNQNYSKESDKNKNERDQSSRSDKGRNENEKPKYKESRERVDETREKSAHSNSSHNGHHRGGSDRRENKSYDRKPEGKHRSSKKDMDKKDNFLKPAAKPIPDADSDENVYEDDEDEEKLVIDINKEKLDEEIRNIARESHKSSKSSHSSSSSNNKHHKESDHHSSKRHRTEEIEKKDSPTKSSSSKSQSSSRTSSKDQHHHHHHQAVKKETEKSSSRNNGEHKSSKSRDNEKSKSSSKEDKSNGKNTKRKRDSLEDSNHESEVEQKTTPKKNKAPKIVADGIDSSMGSFSFEEALGMIAPPSNTKSTPKLKSPKPNGIVTQTSSSSSASSSVFLTPSSSGLSARSKTPPLLASKIKLEPLDPKIAFELPTISPNYKPMPLNSTVMSCVFSGSNQPQKRLMTDEEALCAGISSRTMRTKIYSGVRTGAILQVPSLHNLCIRVLQKNIDALEYTGGVPFDVLKSVLERASPEQLLTFEDYNHNVLEDTDELWKHHCSRRYKTQKRQENETYREMFLRCREEEAERLNTLTKNISHSQKQIAIPLRKTQLAYVDVTVKPPRNVQRKQEQYGTKSKLIATPAARVAALSKMAPSIAKAGDSRLRVAADIRDFAQVTSHIRPKKAPLMQKSLQLMKGRFKR